MSFDNSEPLSVAVCTHIPIEGVSLIKCEICEYILPPIFRTSRRYSAGGTSANLVLGKAQSPNSMRQHLSIAPQTEIPIDRSIFSWPSRHHSSLGPDEYKP